MPVGADDFKQALGCFGSGVTVITVKTADGDHGMTASAFCSLSLDPPLVLVCVETKNATHAHLKAAEGFAVNILAASQKDWSNRFAGYPPMDDRFADIEVERAPHSGAAWLPGSLARLDCALHDVADGGDHSIFIGRVERCTVGEEAATPLIYWKGSYRNLAERL